MKKKFEALKLLKSIREEKINFEEEFKNKQKKYANNIEELTYCKSLLNKTNLNNNCKILKKTSFNILQNYRVNLGIDDFFHAKLSEEELLKASNIYGESFIKDRIVHIENQNKLIEEKQKILSENYEAKISILNRIWDNNYKSFMNISAKEIFKDYELN